MVCDDFELEAAATLGRFETGWDDRVDLAGGVYDFVSAADGFSIVLFRTLAPTARRNLLAFTVRDPLAPTNVRFIARPPLSVSDTRMPVMGAMFAPVSLATACSIFVREIRAVHDDTGDV